MPLWRVGGRSENTDSNMIVRKIQGAKKEKEKRKKEEIKAAKCRKAIRVKNPIVKRIRSKEKKKFFHSPLLHSL